MCMVSGVPAMVAAVVVAVTDKIVGTARCRCCPRRKRVVGQGGSRSKMQMGRVLAKNASLSKLATHLVDFLVYLKLCSAYVDLPLKSRETCIAHFVLRALGIKTSVKVFAMSASAPDNLPVEAVIAGGTVSRTLWALVHSRQTDCIHAKALESHE